MPKTLEQSRQICLIINLSIMEVQELTLEEMKEVNGGSCSCKDRCCDDHCDDGISVELKLKLSIGISL